MFNAIKSYFSDTIVLKNMVTKALKSENEELKDELKIRQKFPIVNGNLVIFNINRIRIGRFMIRNGKSLEPRMVSIFPYRLPDLIPKR